MENTKTTIVTQVSPEELATILVKQLQERGVLCSLPKEDPAPPVYIRGIRELCKRYRASSATIQRLINEKKIPYSKIGTHYLFRPSEVDAALRECK